MSDSEEEEYEPVYKLLLSKVCVLTNLLVVAKMGSEDLSADKAGTAHGGHRDFMDKL